MSHHIYTTPGFIVHSMAQGEAGRYLLLFTRDLGMIGATAQGVRLSQSKLRYYLQDFSHSLFSVVKGKEVWRITGATEIKGSIGDSENRKLYVRILSLVKRLVPGEEKNERLYEVLEKLWYYLCNEITKEEKELVEYVTVLRILSLLGYISHMNVFETIISNPILSQEILKDAQLHTTEIIKVINNGLKESQL